MGYKILARLLLAPIWMLSLLPLKVHYLISDGLAWLLKDVVKYRVKVVDQNIGSAFPAMPEADRKSLAKLYYSHLADIICEIVWAQTRSTKRICRKGVFRIGNEDLLNRLFIEHQSVVVLASHTGNWELSAGGFDYCQNPAFDYSNFTDAYQPLHSRLSEELFHLLRHQFLKYPGNLVSSSEMLRFVLEHRAEKRVYFFIADQYPYKGAGCITEFLGLETEWANGAEAIARKLHLPVAYMYIDNPKRGEYVINFSQICEDASTTEKGEITAAYSKMLEADIYKKKENWLWSHKRWKNLNIYQ
ncbi:MAG: hypothetical protein KBT44_00865 [Bacteroidales bacterium]|nr:hypothetical protein [Candidatus Equibacterium intestinale]